METPAHLAIASLMPWVRIGVLLGFSLSPMTAVALPPDPGDGRPFSFRLTLGNLDGDENARGLQADHPRFTVALSASQAIAWHERLEVTLEGWFTERDYRSTLTDTPLEQGSPTMTFTAAALTYGLRMSPGKGAMRPYLLTSFGFQSSRLATSRITSGSRYRIEETVLTPTVHLGAGVEWRFGFESVALDWRRWSSNGSFSEFAVDSAQLGGEFIGLSLGRHW